MINKPKLTIMKKQCLNFVTIYRKAKFKESLFNEMHTLLNALEVRSGVELSSIDSVISNPSSKYHLLFNLAKIDKFFKSEWSNSDKIFYTKKNKTK